MPTEQFMYYNLYMALSKRPKFQVDAPNEIREQAKELASKRRVSLSELVLSALAKEGDKELTRLIEKHLQERTPPGRPQKPTD